jgi:polysaccharide biosynthesis protein PslG
VEPVRRVPARSAALLAVLVALLATFAAPPARAVELGVSTDLSWGVEAADQQRTSDVLRAAGSRWVRVTVNWRDLEPARGSHNPWWLSHVDAAIASARAADQRVLVVLSSTPVWASSSGAEAAPPRNPADYARFAEFVAQRWGGSIDAYEVWNEPNFSRFWTGSAAAYVELLRTAYPVLKAADPSAPVVFGGPSLNDYEFVERAYRAGAKGSFDALGLHPYTCARPPRVTDRRADGSPTPDSFLAYRHVRAVMRRFGDERPIWFTEMGWSTTSGACGVSEREQAAYLTDAVELARQDPYVQVMLWYNLRNNYWGHDADDFEMRFGLLTTRYERKPAFLAFQRAAESTADPSAWSPIVRIRARVRRGTVRVRGTAPGARRVRVSVSRRRAGGWQPIAARTTRVRGGSFGVAMRVRARGRLRIDARVPATGASAVRHVRSPGSPS